MIKASPGSGVSRSKSNESGSYTMIRAFMQSRCRVLLCTAPHPTRLRRATITIYGIAATGSYKNFDSLRDAPPQGKALNPERSTL